MTSEVIVPYSKLGKKKHGCEVSVRNVVLKYRAELVFTMPLCHFFQLLLFGLSATGFMMSIVYILHLYSLHFAEYDVIVSTCYIIEQFQKFSLFT